MHAAKYREIVAHYESCLERHGDHHRGVDWPNIHDAEKRYRVMLELIRRDASTPVSLLDFGCGAAHLYDFILRNGPRDIDFAGLDLSRKFVSLCQAKYPDLAFYCCDVLKPTAELPDFDYVVMNGVFTEKCSLSFDEMFEYVKQVLSKVFVVARIGLAFNVMSKQVDWERPDLFHLPLDTLADFLTSQLSRNFVIRNDYGLYEYTTYVYK